MTDARPPMPDDPMPDDSPLATTFYSARRSDARRSDARESDADRRVGHDARRAVGDKLGVKKLRKLLAEPLARAQIRCGRDRFYAILRNEGLLVKQKRTRRPQTTDASGWRGAAWPDLRESLRALGDAVLEPERLWVADITYVRLVATALHPQGAFCYAHLITDAYSRKIVGAYVSTTMHADQTLKALTRALDTRLYPEQELCHHSDRGSQYRAEVYTITLAAHGASVSMTQDGCPYDNALAESVNGQFKREYGLDGEFANIEAVENALGEAIAKYNDVRPHGSLAMATPSEVHAHPERFGRFGRFAMVWGKLPTEATTASDNPNTDDKSTCQSLSESLQPL